MLTAAVARAEETQPSGGDAKTFFTSLVGEWIGTCEQSTDGEKAENKYFHAIVKQVSDNSFDTKFDYYRYDDQAGKPIPIGTSGVTTTIAADGSVSNKITGKGVVIVEKKPKDQQHEFTEVLKPASPGSMQGTGKGKISVFGMPLGLGKNGSIDSATSSWTLAGDVLTIDQKLKAGFRAFIFKKSFAVEAHYTAKRGTNVASLMIPEKEVSLNPQPAGQ